MRKKYKSDWGLKATSSCRLTASPYKSAREKSKNSLDVKEKVKIQQKHPIDLSGLEETQNEVLRLGDGDSDLDLPVEKKMTNDQDATSMFCESRFCDDNGGEVWVVCFMCSMWAHENLTGAEKDEYI
ncbi:hypothetical protein PR048_015363 [Dryococelus australis]|uniref:Uncharacterized protein n=1 Tax=Dryococelus australis TaxID=614101 RepID=A0ABQ9HGV2_9NEOP|nr:hypothetical protein PR048_015363 [Dryococelus australis]